MPKIVKVYPEITVYCRELDEHFIPEVTLQGADRKELTHLLSPNEGVEDRVYEFEIYQRDATGALLPTGMKVDIHVSGGTVPPVNVVACSSGGAITLVWA